MEDNNVMGTGKIGKLLFKYALPCVLSLLISALYNVVDQLFIGNSSIGYMGNVATTVVFPLTIFALAISLLMGYGASAYLALGQGKKDTTNARKAIGATITLTVILGGLFTLFTLIFFEPLLGLLGASESSLPLAKEYGIIILSGIVFSFFTNVLNPIIRSDGASMFAMIAQGSGAIINIILDPIMIYALNMGLSGAAYATIIGQAVSTFLSLAYLFKTKTFKLQGKDFILGFRYILDSLRLGISSFFIQVSLVAVTIASNQILKIYGASTVYGSDVPVAVFGITYKVFTIVVNIPIGIALGGLSIMGYNYGAKKYDSVKKTNNLVLISSFIVSALATILFEADPMLIISMFGSESAEYNEFGILCFRIYLAFIIFTSFQRPSSVFFQSIGKPVEATILSLARDLILLVPLTCLLPMKWGLNGFLYSAPIADAISFVLTIVLVTLEYRRLYAQEKAETESKRLISVATESN